MLNDEFDAEENNWNILYKNKEPSIIKKNQNDGKRKNLILVLVWSH